MDYSFDFKILKNVTPTVTLSSLGSAFNRGAVDMLGSPDQIIVGYDEKNKPIGVRPRGNDTTSPHFDFAPRVKHEWVRIGAKDFVKYLAKITKIGAVVFIIAAIVTVFVSSHQAADTADTSTDTTYTAEELEHDHDGDGIPDHDASAHTDETGDATAAPSDAASAEPTAAVSEDPATQAPATEAPEASEAPAAE